MKKLKPFQAEGARWLSTKRFALLADEMGLGKSAQTIAACDIIFASRILIVCPAIARPMWVKEFRKFSDYPRRFHVPLTRKDIPRPGGSVVLSYDLATYLWKEKLWRGQDFDVAIFDEGHFLKEFKATRTQACLGVSGFARQAKRTWILTGTPMPNHAGELWPFLITGGRTTLKFDAFIRRFCTTAPGFSHKWAARVTGTQKGRLPELAELLSPLMLRRTVDEVLPDLPPLTFSERLVEPGPVSMPKELLDRVADELGFLEDHLGPENKLLTVEDMNLLEALAQSVATLRLYNGLQKVAPALERVTDRLKNKACKKIILFAVHREVINQLRLGLRPFGAVSLHGGTSPKKKQEHIDRFQNDPSCKVVICNIKTAGTAVTLTAANREMFVEYEWCPADNFQAAKRAHRIGTTKPVFAEFLSIAGSIDEKITTAVRRKTRDAQALFDSINDAKSR